MRDELIIDDILHFSFVVKMKDGSVKEIRYIGISSDSTVEIPPKDWMNPNHLTVAFTYDKLEIISK